MMCIAVIIFTIGIKDVENNLDTRIYPNPVDEMLIIDFPQTIERIEVYDVFRTSNSKNK